MAFVLPTAMSHPRYKVTTAEICADIHRANRDRPSPELTDETAAEADVQRADSARPRPARPELIDRIAASVGVKHRYFSAPLAEIAAAGTISERQRAAFGHLRERGIEAAQQVMAQHGIRPSDVDILVTSHATGDAKPGLDIALVNALGLPRNVRRVQMTELACGGGAQSLIRAADLIAAGRGHTALVVVAETLSTVYHHSDTGADSVAFKYLFGDSGGAAIVTSTAPSGPSLQILDTLELVIPDTEHYYRQRHEPDGIHFDSTRAAIRAVDTVMPDLWDWLRTGSGDPTWAADHVVAHPGGPAVLERIQKGLDVSDDRLRYSRASLADGGNRGGPAVLDILRRLMDDPPAHGSEGILLAFAPGFAAAALRTKYLAGSAR